MPVTSCVDTVRVFSSTGLGVVSRPRAVLSPLASRPLCGAVRGRYAARREVVCMEDIRELHDGLRLRNELKEAKNAGEEIDEQQLAALIDSSSYLNNDA